MNFASDVVGDKRRNAAPELNVLHEHVLHARVTSVGVFVERPCELSKPYSGWIQRAWPLGMVVAVTWIAERGLLLVDGDVAGSGSLYERHMPKKSSVGTNPVETGTPRLVAEALDGTVVCFTEFVDSYFDAVERAVAVSHDLPAKVRATLAGKLGAIQPVDVEDYATWPQQDPRLGQGLLDLVDEVEVERFVVAHMRRHGHENRR